MKHMENKRKISALVFSAAVKIEKIGLSNDSISLEHIKKVWKDKKFKSEFETKEWFIIERSGKYESPPVQTVLDKYVVDKSYAETYIKFIYRVMLERYGKLHNKSEVFGKSIIFNEKDIPTSAKNRNLYEKVADMYVLTNKDKKGFKAVIKRISKSLNQKISFYH